MKSDALYREVMQRLAKLMENLPSRPAQDTVLTDSSADSPPASQTNAQLPST